MDLSASGVACPPAADLGGIGLAVKRLIDQFLSDQINSTAGRSFSKPFGLRGEIGLGTSWAQPIKDALSSQFGAETY